MFDEVEHGMEGGLVAVVGHGQPSERSLSAVVSCSASACCFSRAMSAGTLPAIAMSAHM